MIVVYSQPNCQQCVAVKRWLNNRDVDFEVESAEDHVEMLKELGYLKAPVTIVGGTIHWYGFDPDSLERYCTPGEWPTE